MFKHISRNCGSVSQNSKHKQQRIKLLCQNYCKIWMKQINRSLCIHSGQVRGPHPRWLPCSCWLSSERKMSGMVDLSLGFICVDVITCILFYTLTHDWNLLLTEFAQMETDWYSGCSGQCFLDGRSVQNGDLQCLSETIGFVFRVKQLSCCWYMRFKFSELHA